jgi:hypothetical protein
MLRQPISDKDNDKKSYDEARTTVCFVCTDSFRQTSIGHSFRHSHPL